MKIDGKVVELVRSEIAGTSTTSGDTISEFTRGTVTLSVHFEVLDKTSGATKANANRAATLKLSLNGRDFSVRGRANCGGE